MRNSSRNVKHCSNRGNQSAVVLSRHGRRSRRARRHHARGRPDGRGSLGNQGRCSLKVTARKFSRIASPGKANVRPTKSKWKKRKSSGRGELSLAPDPIEELVRTVGLDGVANGTIHPTLTVKDQNRRLCFSPPTPLPFGGNYIAV